MVKKVSVVIALLFLIGTGVFIAAGYGWFGRHESPGSVSELAIPQQVIEYRSSADNSAAARKGVVGAKRILFGDLHIHTTISIDAFNTSLPVYFGEGAHPPADACDFARYCSAVDFWAITDHASSITPRHWRETIESVRQCNAVANDPQNPDVVAFLGYEWTQVGLTPETHYGHKNVIFRDLEQNKIPTHPIMSYGGKKPHPNVSRKNLALLALEGKAQRYLDYATYMNELAGMKFCPQGVDVRTLPDECTDFAPTPKELFSKLRQWNLESMVIPHGTAWGAYTPAGSSWDNQLKPAMHDPSQQFLVELFSGHGNAEQYRDWRAIEFDAAGNTICPRPREDYVPSCWRAGEIIRERCLATGETDQACEQRAALARNRYLEGGAGGHLTVPGVEVSEWLDAGQCRDCDYMPVFNLRPMNSVQYMMARQNFDEPENPQRFSFGIIASSDNHTARPGTGYKEMNRAENIERFGVVSEEYRNNILVPNPLGVPAWEPEPDSIPFSEVSNKLPSMWQMFETERRSSFMSTGGLVAVHAEGRDRNSIWQALKQREVYGTSGDRMLLWFDLIDGGGQTVSAMGSEIEYADKPRFRVRAIGAFKQTPGCPDYTVRALSPERLHHLCQGECYNPSNERKLITRIEVIRVMPQLTDDEPIDGLIEDPWKVLDCKPDPSGCEVIFEDEEFPGSNRDTLYYVRAIEEPSETINAGNLRCEYDENGACIKVTPCYGDYRTDFSDDCLTAAEERAWSSPIFLIKAS